jgi:S-(hydroxymethyl)glutathione dehydrogenase/alcohol dehydrogenase
VRAAIFTDVDQPLAVEDVTVSAPGPRDVVVRVDASGVCHSDLSVLNGAVPYPGPTILGHEGAGVVLEVGERVERFRPGDTVIATLVPGCGACPFCAGGQAHLCQLMRSLAPAARATRSDGASATALFALGTFAETMTVDERSLVKVETDVPADQLSLIGCGVTTGVGAALSTARVEPGSTVVVLGCGGVGIAVVQGARIAGAARILAVDPVELKRKTAEQLGATDLVDTSAGDPVAQVLELTGGRGADYVFEVVGRPETILQSYAMTRRGGAVVLVGLPAHDAMLTLTAGTLLHGEKRLLPSIYGSAQVQRDFPRFVGLVESGQLDLGAMVSRRITLDEVNGAFRAMEAGESVRSVIVR